jgi:hypothetical protein
MASETLLLLNPRKRGAKKRRVRRNPVGAYMAGGKTSKITANPRRRRKVRRNPIAARRRSFGGASRGGSSLSMNSVAGLLKPGVAGVGGAITVDTLLNLAPIPQDWREGMLGMLTRAGGAILLGTLGRKIIGPTATQMAIGALTVQGHQFASGMLSSVLPGAPMSAPAAVNGMGYVSPARSASVPGARAPSLQLAGGRMSGIGGRVSGRVGAYMR